MKRILFVIFIIVLFTTIGFAQSKDSKDAKDPKKVDPFESLNNVIVISTSCTQYCLFITCIDTDTNELAVLQCSIMSPNDGYDLGSAIKNEIKIDSSKQKLAMGQNAPFIAPKQNTSK